MTPVAMADGKRYLLGMSSEGYLTMHDLSKPSGQTLVSTSSTKLMNFSGTLEHYGNTLGISNDGKWLYAGGEYNTSLNIYSTQAVINAMKNNTDLPAAVRSIILPAERGFAGDVMELPNGDLLMSTYANVVLEGVRGTGLYIAQRTGDGTYGTPKKVGNIAFPQANSDRRIESLALIYPNGISGEPKIVVSQLAAGSTYKNYVLNVIPKYADSSITYGLTEWAITANDHPSGTKYADATSGSMAPCTAYVNVSGVKTWIGDTAEDRPTSITVVLESSNDPYTTWTQVSTKVVQADINGNWIYTFMDLPKFDSAGKSIQYRVREVGTPQGYTVTYPTNQGPYDVVNTMTKTASFKIRKIKEGTNTALPGAEFTLYGSRTIPTTPPTLAPDLTNVIQGPTAVNNNGELTFTGLSKGTYFLKETKAPEGYILNETYHRVEITVNTQNQFEVKVYDS